MNSLARLRLAPVFTPAFAPAFALALALTACGDDESGDDNGKDTPDAGPVYYETVDGSVVFHSVAGEPIDPPVADDCITEVGPGDHKLSCDGITYYVLVTEECTKRACGLIFDVHGATMSGLQMRDNTLLDRIAPEAGFIYVNPSATASNTGGTWDLTSDPPKVAAFLERVIDAFHVNPKRVHVTGFSQGGATTFYILEHHNDILASAAPVAGALMTPTWATDSWKPQVPMLIMNGTTDTAVTIEASRALVDAVVTGLGLEGGDEIEGDGHYSWTRYTGDDGMVLEVIEHDYGGQAVLEGHCIPGGVDVAGAPNNFNLNATTCTTGDIKLNWGELVLKWFIDHPKP